MARYEFVFAVTQLERHHKATTRRRLRDRYVVCQSVLVLLFAACVYSVLVFRWPLFPEGTTN